MAFNSSEALREAGILGGTMTPELEEFYATLTQQETETLITLKSRLSEVLPDVAAHSTEWAKPAAGQEGLDAAMLCACGAWSGAGRALDE